MNENSTEFNLIASNPVEDLKKMPLEAETMLVHDELSVDCYPEQDPPPAKPLYDHVNIRKPQNLGLFYCKTLQSFTENITMWRPGIYPFFGVYLNMPGHRYNAINSIFSLFWSFKFFWGLISDSWPIFGKSRIYYMAIGFFFSGFAYLGSVLIPMPASYYKVEDCALDKSKVQNPDAPDSGMFYIAVMALAVFTTGVADLAGDALVVDYTREESEKHKGRSNAWAYICSRIGTCIHYCIIGFALNAPAYGGTFCNNSFSYRHVLVIYCSGAFLSMLFSLTMTFERSRKHPKQSLKRKLLQFWETTQSCLFQQIAIMFVLVPGLLNAKSSAQVKIRKNWAGVEPLTGSMNAVACSMLAAFGMYVFQKFALQKNWRKIFIVSQFIMIGVAVLVEGLTIFDVIRSQYFYFSEDLLLSFGHGMGHFILLQLAAEIARPGLEALTFGVMMTNWTMSTVLSSVIGNLVSVPFGVIEDERFFSDTCEDRWMVFGSVATVAAINASALALFYILCPAKRSHLKQLQEKLGESKNRATLCVLVFVCMFALSILYNTLIIVPATQCLVFVGGKGC